VVAVSWRLVRLTDEDDNVDDRVGLFRFPAEFDIHEAEGRATDLLNLRTVNKWFELVDFSCWEEFC
jgi:hypothetical protein